MYIILDGHVDFTIDLNEKELSGKEIDQLCSDLHLKKNDVVKKIVNFKDFSGLT